LNSHCHAVPPQGDFQLDEDDEKEIQYLGFANRASCGIPLTFNAGEDKHGRVLLMGDTWELTSGRLGITKGDEPAVRVLVKEGTTKAEVLALLAKIVGWIEKDGMPN
jgi:hypothetical protein